MSDTTNGATESRKKFQRMKQTYDNGVITTIFTDTKLTRTCDILLGMPEKLAQTLRQTYPALVDAASYGLMQKEKDSNSDWPGSDQEAAEAMDTIDAEYFAGRFGGRSGTGDVVNAIAAILSIPIETALKAWLSYSDEKKDDTRKHAKIKAHIKMLEAQRAASRAATDTTDFVL
jgi:hypothetical protein